MTYMVILSAGILYVSFHKRWALLTRLGMGFTWLLFTAWVFQHYRESRFWITLLFLNIFFLIYAAAPFAYYFIRERAEGIKGYAPSIVNTFIAFGYSYAFISEYASRQYASLVSVIYTAIFAAMAQYLYTRQRENRDAFVLLMAKAMLFLVITVPVLFSRHWITVFWTAQAAAIIWAALRLKNRYLYMGGSALLTISVVKFIIWDLERVFLFSRYNISFLYGYQRLLAERYLLVTVLLAALFLCARLLSSAGEEFTLAGKADQGVFYGAFGSFLFLVLNVEVSGLFHDYMPQARFASISVLWTLFSVSLMAIGFYYRQAIVRRVSIGLFALTVVKVFFVDMSNASTPFRIISFIVLGLMLIGASFLYHRYKGLIMPEIQDVLPVTGQEGDEN
jgi:uncharacterized membrane protein